MGVLICAGVLFVLVAPWTVRNYLAFNRFVPLNTNSGFAFFWANHPIHGTSFIAILPAQGPSYQDLIPVELRHLDEAALDQALLRGGLRFVAEDRGAISCYRSAGSRITLCSGLPRIPA